MSDGTTLRIGTRKSPLALWQARFVAAELKIRTGVDADLVEITTRGDHDRAAPIESLGSQGVFTKEIQRALLAGEVDLAVHSLKDLPTEEVAGLGLASVPRRASVADVLISRAGHALADLPRGARVGTSSIRRRAQLLHHRPDFVMADIRGNVETRLAKLRNGHYDALVLAEAGLSRLGLESAITERFPDSFMLPAIGQGALGIEARHDDEETRRIVAQLEDRASRAAVDAERSMLATLQGGCLAPVAGLARMDSEGCLQLRGVVLSDDGRIRLEAADDAKTDNAMALGSRVAELLLTQGAAHLIDAARNEPSRADS